MYVDWYEPDRRNIDYIVSEDNKLYMNVDEYKNFFCFNPSMTDWLVKSYIGWVKKNGPVLLDFFFFGNKSELIWNKKIK